MNWIESILLGIVQGFTEFLPVSSSGHLVLAQSLLNFSQPSDHIMFDLIVHLGTLLVVLFVYRKTLYGYITAGVVFFFSNGQSSFFERFKESDELQEIYMILLATLPTACIGILLRKHFERFFNSLEWVGVFFAMTGFLLLATLWSRDGEKTIRTMGVWRALAIGLVQGCAIAPGISRSGATIACGLVLGLGKEESARFSFLLSIPAILGAVLLKGRELNFEHLDGVPLILGGIAAAVSGMAALLVVLRLVNTGRLAWFSPYLWGVSVFIMVRCYI